MKLLALDLSLTNAGVAWLLDVRAGQPVWDVETVRVPESRVPGKRPGTLINGGVLKGVQRLAWWESWLVEEIAGGVELVVCEAPILHGNMASDIGEMMGVVKLACYKRDVPLILVAPSAVKKWATGSGCADKERMISAATEALGGEVTLNEHEADAYWLGQIAWCAGGDGEPDTPYRCAVLAKILAAFAGAGWEKEAGE